MQGWRLHLEFQLTRPHGARFQPYCQKYAIHQVSTHAPAWGAISIHEDLIVDSKFQLTRPHGARCDENDIYNVAIGFNSRARMGRDVGKKTRANFLKSFNSRARMGRDGQP